ncbi:MAG: aldo/keto reductase [Christensenellaceae bacterium]
MIGNMNDCVRLRGNVMMPAFGLGVYKAQPGDEVYQAIRFALDAGYRLIDTAAYYFNEVDVGRALRDSGIDRSQVFITTKIWPSFYEHAQEEFEKSLKALEMEYVDLYLLHWPGIDKDLRYKAWEMMLKEQQKGRIRAVGVSNFMQPQLEELIRDMGVTPANNQVELHPWHQQRELRKYCANKEIAITSWGPIFHGHLAEEPLMDELAFKYNKSAAQVTLRWHVQHGINLIPKSVHQDRIIENSQIFDFELRKEDMEEIDALDGKKKFAFDSYAFDGDVEKVKR